MKKNLKAAVIILVIVAVIAGAVLQLLGIYVATPNPEPLPGSSSASGETIIFMRRMTTLPFLFSADSMALKYGIVPNEKQRPLIDMELRGKIAKRIIARLPYSRVLYMKSTGNRNFLPAPKP